MFKFLATTENEKIQKLEEPIYNRGKVVKKAEGNCYSQFSDIEIYQSRAVLFETEGRVITNNKKANWKWTRVKGRQLKFLNGPATKTYISS